MKKWIEPNYRTIFESTPGLYLILSPDLDIVAVSDAYLKATMTDRAKILGRGLFEIFPDNPDDSTATGTSNLGASLRRVLSCRALDKMPIQKYDIRRPESEGGGFEERYWKPVNLPILKSSGDVAYIIHSVEDVTQLITQEGKQKSLEAERDLMFDHSFDLMGIVGADGYFKRLNPSFKRTLGYSNEELCSKPIVEFLHPDDIAMVKKGIQTLASGTATIESKNRYRCKDGTYKWFSWNTTPLGSLFFTVGRDITEQIEAEERIRHLNHELELKNEDLELKIQERMKELLKSEAQVQQLQKMDAIGRLAGGIAHDFNNMLGAISMYCDILADDSKKPEAVLESVQDMREVTARAAALTRQLLIFSRKQISERQTISLNPLIKQLEKMLMRLIGENIEIIPKLAADLHFVSVDPSQMEQVILNLVVNAKDAMPKGGTITLETSNIYLDEEFTSTHLSVSRGHYVLLAVSDNGSGMDQDTIAKIFEPFFTTKPVGKGTGLGLTTTYGIVKQSKGTIWVYSEPGKGTVFKIYLPIAETLTEEPGLTPAIAPNATGNQTILLVEDDEKLRTGFSTMLRRRGYEVIVASGAEEALELCQNHGSAIDLVLTDIVMPGISGFELAKKLLALRNNLRVLYMSGYTSDSLEKSGIENLEQLAFIQKPFDTNALIAKVQEVLSRGS